MTTDIQYTPLTLSEAAEKLGVQNLETFQRKFREKTGKRLTDLTDGRMQADDFVKMVIHFHKNYPKAHAIYKTLELESSDIRTVMHPNERTIGRPDGRTDELPSERMQADERMKLWKPTLINQESAIEKLNLEHKNELIEVKRNCYIEFNKEFNERLVFEMKRISDEYEVKLSDLRTENGQLKQSLSDERTLGRSDEIERLFTVRLDKAKSEWEKQERIRRADERTKSDGIIFDLRHQLSKKEDDLKVIQIELNRIIGVSKSFDFKIKSLWREELDTINIVSNVLALYGFTVLFHFVGLISIILMIMFFKNTMKNVKLAKRDVAKKFGMRIAILIECIYGFFHYTTFYDILKNKTDSLLIKDAQLVSIGMMVIVSGLSIAALVQAKNQAQDDFNN